MKEATIETLKAENTIDLIAKQWMLVTAGTKDSFNTMTANWGGIGYLWNKNVAFVFVRPERYTHDFIDKETMAKWYGEHGGFHTVYVVEIEKVYSK